MTLTPRLILALCVVQCCRRTEATVSLIVRPDRQQFFFLRAVFSLSCEDEEEEEENSSGWKVKRRTGAQTEECGVGGFGRLDGSSCRMSDPYPSDSGDYWCESSDGARSNEVHITVTGGQVILDVPARPVMEGSDVTLFCKISDGSRQPADFYRNNTFITAAPETGFTISPVQQSDEGFYRCFVGYVGRSAESWLSVRARPLPPSLPPTAAPPPSTCDPTEATVFLTIIAPLWVAAPPPSASMLVRLLCHLVVCCPYCICTVLLLSMCCSRKGNKTAVPMETAQRDQGLVEEYDDVAADVTTEHAF
ncbi:uncharacterized protein LOC115376674 isoform X2 [Myripristis murdjan]|uniref:uncharacterized protein LOC115376674 isoform X2 n=1 Tax=Myripristis murdjan TaxID=586833 RepID=UPI0011760446|nr:uncharacterized protein LOC115376674 isoform X2 [Myripristis murdjan]